MHLGTEPGFEAQNNIIGAACGAQQRLICPAHAHSLAEPGEQVFSSKINSDLQPYSRLTDGQSQTSAGAKLNSCWTAGSRVCLRVA